MSTRTLLILAAVTGVAILTAGAVQILLARWFADPRAAGQGGADCGRV